MQTFRKKPIIIEAVQYIKNVDTNMMGLLGPVFGMNFNDLPSWIIDNQIVWPNLLPAPLEGKWWVNSEGIMIGTKEGQHQASPGDWIIRGIQGEIYPCKPDIFAASYEMVATNDQLDEILGYDENDSEDTLCHDLAINFQIQTHDGYWIKKETDLWIFESNESNSHS